MSNWVKERVRIALLALEALLTLPLTLGYSLKRWVQAKRVECLITHIAIKQEGFLSGTRTNVTEFAVEALPVRLELRNERFIVLSCDHLPVVVV
jgi:hypothetical protein